MKTRPYFDINWREVAPSNSSFRDREAYLVELGWLVSCYWAAARWLDHREGGQYHWCGGCLHNNPSVIPELRAHLAAGGLW